MDLMKELWYKRKARKYSEKVMACTTERRLVNAKQRKYKEQFALYLDKYDTLSNKV